MAGVVGEGFWLDRQVAMGQRPALTSAFSEAVSRMLGIDEALVVVFLFFASFAGGAILFVTGVWLVCKPPTRSKA